MTFKRRKTGDQWEDEGAKKAAATEPEIPSKQLHVRLTESELAALARAARDHDTSMVRIARRAIRAFIADHDGQQSAPDRHQKRTA